MSHDGCLEVAWKGKAFPYLMHHPNFHQTENYGSAKSHLAGHHGAGSSHGHGHGHSQPRTEDGESVFQAGTGTWNGPAPRGYQGTQAAASTASPSGPVSEPDYVRLHSGTKMPLLGLGTFGLKDAASVKTALELGYRHIDCAEVYGNEALVGEGLREFVGSGRREELFITSKLWNNHHRPEHVRPACEKTLADLGLQYLDLYLIHWPVAWLPECQGIPENPSPDTSVTLAQTWAAMEELVDAGLVKAIGVSNFDLPHVEQLLGSCRIKPSVNQIELHPLLPQRKLVGVCLRKGVQCVAYSPLGGQSCYVQNDLISNTLVAKVAQEAGKSPAQVLLRWNMQRGIPVIPKASSPEHLKQNIEDAFKWRLSNEHKALLDTLDAGKRFITYSWKQWADPEEGGVAKPSLTLLK
mmetsp:Transcript_13752/g.29583  ORF Transcript_13752/g.29583 Transcript_13752/m.29583 type:complete len:409 (-) Transcript_13752:535-1761(-)|eukprot:CAMPEP_0202898404 /NCGR_PEP_ID=MMETSP1392-20130828/6934_1 /ASSEMBLY_ACC=CAM_ASM_000868 /TAXON_ID=225041 /ORGANISM="Chlamydomonas chlamydogama, Strain SAG 11-48b" /LENGTH=408 /DNA_ID=CAMNT_0049584325 /DNA_START=96 /DNA_END=1322 /DNA_ORIENTATION=-